MFIKILLVLSTCLLFVKCDKNPVNIDWDKTGKKDYYLPYYDFHSIISDNNGVFYGINQDKYFCKITLTKELVISQVDTINEAMSFSKLFKDKSNGIIRTNGNSCNFNFDVHSGMSVPNRFDSLLPYNYSENYTFSSDNTLWIAARDGINIVLFSWDGNALKKENQIQVNSYIEHLLIAASNDSVYITCQSGDSTVLFTYDKEKYITKRSIRFPDLSYGNYNLKSFYVGGALYWQVVLSDSATVNVYNESGHIINIKGKSLLPYSAPFLLKRDHDLCVLNDVLEGAYTNDDFVNVNGKVYIPVSNGIEMINGKDNNILKLPYGVKSLYKDSLNNVFFYNNQTRKLVKMDTTLMIPKASYVYPH